MGFWTLGFAPSTSNVNESQTINISNTPTLTAFNFTSGVDAPGIDPLLSYIGSLITPLPYSRRAHYSIAWTPATQGGGSLTPILDMRGMRCRQFYADGVTSFSGFSSPPPYGTQTGYGFTTNPIWHFVDLWLRRAVKPEYAISSVSGPDTLTAAESALFNWPSIVAAANYCDQVINITSQNPAGTPRFSGSYVFSSGSTLAAMLEQVMLCCRGYWYEDAGQIYVFVDQPRSSTLLITSQALANASFEVDNTIVNQNGNRYMGQYLELGLPTVSQIATISLDGSGTTITVETVNPNPCAIGDLISIGGVGNPAFNQNCTVSAVPDSTNSLTAKQFTAAYAGSAVSPGTSSTGGLIGYIQSRFSQRNPEINHQQHQLCEGQILPPNTTGTRLKRIKVNYDFASMTYDQAMRLLQYEVYRDLGIDWLNYQYLMLVFGNLNSLGAPYTPPWQVTLNLWSEWVDKSLDTSTGQTNPALWRALKAQRPGDVVTLDPTVFYEYAGDYEIMKMSFNPFQQEVADSTGGGFLQPVQRARAMNNGTDQNSGVIQLVLRTFNSSPAIFTDVSMAMNSSFATVPGQMPYAGVAKIRTVIEAFTVTITYPANTMTPAILSWPTITVDQSGSIVFVNAGSTGVAAPTYVSLLPGVGPFILYLDTAFPTQPVLILSASYAPTPTMVQLLLISALASGDFYSPHVVTYSVPTTTF
jgi:hypothetical protein